MRKGQATIKVTVHAVTIVLLGLSLGLIGGVRAVYASGTQVQDCTFATLQADLQGGGDWYYAPGQCPNYVFFNGGITIGTGISASLTSQGNDVQLIIDPHYNLFAVGSGGSLGLTGLTLFGTSSYTSMVSNAGGTVTINNSVLYNNAYILGNNNPGVGGAISNSSGMVTITDSVLSGNQASDAGGAIANGGTMTIANSSLLQNTSGSRGGGAISNGGTMTITNSTLSDNQALNNAGAINNSGTMTITNSTLWDNNGTSTQGGVSGESGQQIYNWAGSVGLAGTIIANPYVSPANCYAAAGDEGYNLDTDGSCLNGGTGDITTSAPGLDTTHASTVVPLLAGSPALDAIPLSYDYTGSTPLCPPTDQRGVVRPDNGESACDIGAFEAGEPTTTALTSSDNPSVVGEQVTYTATIAPVPDGGTVTFYDGGPSGNVICSQVPVSTSGPDTGTATCAVTYTGTGSHSITAAYGGDISYMSSTSAAVTQTVDRAPTTTTVTPSSNPSILNQPVTFIAVVTVNAPGAGTPTGTVTFKDGTTTLGSSALDGTGTATITTSSLTVGIHNITASYSGDANYVNGTSTALGQQVSYVISPLPSSTSRKGTTVALQLLDYNNVNVGSRKTITVTALCVVAYGTTVPTSCGSQPIQTINSSFTFSQNYQKMGAAYSYTVSPTGLTTGTQYYLLLQADGDPVIHALAFTD